MSPVVGQVRALEPVAEAADRSAEHCQNLEGLTSASTHRRRALHYVSAAKLQLLDLRSLKVSLPSKERVKDFDHQHVGHPTLQCSLLQHLDV